MKNKLMATYDISMLLLAIISVLMTIMDFAGEIVITSEPYYFVDNAILIIFAIDYFTRLFMADNKLTFFKNNIFELLSIIPVNLVFNFFRLSRVFQVARLLRILRLTRGFGLIGRMRNNFARLFNKDGLVYLLYISISILLISAGLYSFSEHVNFWQALWWAIVTATTVGYGDLSPTTVLGKVAAILLMFVGIGFVGMLTSSLTTYLSHEQDQRDNDELFEAIHKENVELKKELHEIRELLEKHDLHHQK